MEVSVSRTIDLDHVVGVLRGRGLDPQVEELAVLVRCEDEDELCDGLVAELEAWVAEEGLPLVPERADGHVYLRPPGG